MVSTGAAERLMIYLEGSDRTGGTPTYVEIVVRARKAGLGGATVLQGAEGFGASSRLHRQRGLSVVADIPVVVTIVDSASRIDSFLASLGDLDLHGLVTREPAEVIMHRR